MYRSRLLGIGMNVPSRVVTNHELATKMETSHDWIVERSGIETRRWVSEGETGATMATAASREAIQRAGLEPKDIDLIIYATLSTHINADGSEAEILWTEYPASARQPRITSEAMAERKHYPAMNGKKVFKHAVTRMPQAMMEGMVANQLKLTDIDMVIPHQANLRINQMVAKMIGLPEDRMHNNIQKYGNTTAASIPICMNEAIELGKIKPGDLVCLVAFGAGLTWGSAFLRY